MTFGVVGSGIKKQVALVLATMAIIVSLPFIAVVSMGSSVLTFLASVPSAAAAETQGFYMGGPVPGDTYEWGNCTYWSFAMRLWAGSPIPTTWGNANTWDDRAKLDDYIVDYTPKAGAIFQTDDGKWGHVAYVTSVNPTTGEWTISEMNVAGLNIVGTRTFSSVAAAHYNFIHTKKGAAPWTPLIILNQLPPTGGLQLPH
jgi:surface antigen